MSKVHDLPDAFENHSSTGLLTGLEKSDREAESIYHSRNPIRYSVLIPWLLCFVLFIITFALGLSVLKSDNCVPYWASTEFIGAKNEITATLQKVRFTAGLAYNDQKQLYRIPHPELPQYVGEPSEEIDAAWKDLIGSIDVFVMPTEEPSLGGDLYQDKETDLYMGDVSVFHDLHCLNKLRKNLYFNSDYYWEDQTKNGSRIKTERTHIEHCLDSLRQSLMCTGDMTVLPIYWSDEMSRITPDFQIEHTCRDYEALKKWAYERDSSDPNRYMRNAERLKAKAKGKE